MSLNLLVRRLAVWRPPWAAALLALALALLTGAGTALAGSRDSLTLLLPDNADTTSWKVKVWTDTAAEEGLQIKPMSDAAFIALGSAANASISGLILPDSAHIQASDGLVAAVKQFVTRGGKLLLVYDAASLNDTGFYDISGRSRFSDLAGVDYVQYEALRDRVVGFGRVVGARGLLDDLSLPPGKYLPYQAASPNPVVAQSVYVPTSRFDPGGSEFMRAWLRARGNSQSPVFSGLRYDQGVANATPSLSALLLNAVLWMSGRNSGEVGAVATSNGASWSELTAAQAKARQAAGDAELQLISGYGFGPLSYYSFVTTGVFPGKVLLSSPEFGLVAGERSYGQGEVLFMNLPLGFFKAIGTDGALLHGTLGYFARDMVGMPRLSAQPRGVGGLVYNWHVDDGDDIAPELRSIMAADFMQGAGPFSVHFTAGPDVSAPGDGLGMNLPANAVAQDVVQRTGKDGRYVLSWTLLKHAIGSHGGWNHNLYGLNANETNEAIYAPWLQLNFQAITNVTGERQREYSAPMGNNPAWAVRWIEQYGVVAMYTVSNTGSPATREWRDGARLTTKLWAMPVAPLGVSATFEEFEENGVSDATSAQWLLDLQSFVVNKRSNRLFYNHPPGALAHLNVVKTFVARGGRLAANGRFQWYTMSDLADFAQRRIQTGWASAQSLLGFSVFTLSNAQSLTDVTMLLPRSGYNLPVVYWGLGTVSSDETNWIVTARGGTQLQFLTSER